MLIKNKRIVWIHVMLDNMLVKIWYVRIGINNNQNN